MRRVESILIIAVVVPLTLLWGAWCWYDGAAAGAADLLEPLERPALQPAPGPLVRMRCLGTPCEPRNLRIEYVLSDKRIVTYRLCEVR